MLHFYGVISLLMALAALGSFASAFFAREASNRKVGIAFCYLFFAGSLACLALNRGWF